MTYQEDTKRFNELANYRVKCKCSHSITMINADRTICTHCGEWIYRTPKLKFRYKMKEQLIKEEKNDNQIRQTRENSNS